MAKLWQKRLMAPVLFFSFGALGLMLSFQNCSGHQTLDATEAAASTETTFRSRALASDTMAGFAPVQEPNLFFNSKELEDLRLRLQSGEKPLNVHFFYGLKKKADLYLKEVSEKSQPISSPYLGKDIADMYEPLTEDSTRAFSLALLAQLTGEPQYATAAKAIIRSWIFSSISSTTKFADFTCYDSKKKIDCPSAGYAIHLGKGLMHFAGAYDLLRGIPNLYTQDEITQMEAFFRKGLGLLQVGAKLWASTEGGVMSCHWISNHSTAHTSAVMTLAAVLGDESLLNAAISGTGAVPYNWKTLLERSIYMLGEPAIGCESPPRAPMLSPHTGEVVDRYRGFQYDFPAPLPAPDQTKCQAGNRENRGIGYSLANMIHLSYGAIVAQHRAIDLFNYTAPKGENMMLPARYYSYYLSTFPNESIVTPSDYVGSQNYLNQCVRVGELAYFEFAASAYKSDFQVVRAFDRYSDSDLLRSYSLDVLYFGKNYSRNRIRWNFMNDNIYDGWRGSGTISTLNVSRGSINYLTTGPGALLIRDDVSFYAPANAKLRITARIFNMNPSRPLNSTTFRFFWKTYSDTVFSSGKMVQFPVTVDQEFRQYEISLSANTNWKGLVRALRVDAASDAQLSVSIRSIEIVN